MRALGQHQQEPKPRELKDLRAEVGGNADPKASIPRSHQVTGEQLQTEMMMARTKEAFILGWERLMGEGKKHQMLFRVSHLSPASAFAPFSPTFSSGPQAYRLTLQPVWVRTHNQEQPTQAPSPPSPTSPQAISSSSLWAPKPIQNLKFQPIF